jgi:hypothetical protein
VPSNAFFHTKRVDAYFNTGDEDRFWVDTEDEDEARV